MIIGAGMIGLGVLQILKLERISKIIVLEISEERSQVARALGADIVLNPISEGEGLKDRIYELTDGIGADLIYDCAGVPMAFQTSMDCVKSGGQILVIGVYEQKVPFSLWDLLHREIEVKGVFSSYDEFQEVIELLSEGKINTDLFISSVISQRYGEKGLRPAHSKAIKIIVKWMNGSESPEGAIEWMFQQKGLT
jgi:threonine dehydrogenase-like Zn-dependent dehydrogenase